jgi:hypothetical protein
MGPNGRRQHLKGLHLELIPLLRECHTFANGWRAPIEEIVEARRRGDLSGEDYAVMRRHHLDWGRWRFASALAGVRKTGASVS